MSIDGALASQGAALQAVTLGPVIIDLEELTGVAVRRIRGYKGYRGHDYPDRFEVRIDGQVRRDRPSQERSSDASQPSQMVAPAIASNAVLAAAGYNFRWFEQLLRILSLILWKLASKAFFKDDQKSPAENISLSFPF
jgi:IS5 family transposase